MPAKKANTKPAATAKAQRASKTASKPTSKTTSTSAPKAAPKAAPKSAPNLAPKAAPKQKKPPQSMPYEQGKWAHVFAPRAPGERRYWLVKSEPDVFSFQDLMAAPQRTTCWDSVRSTGARNFLRDGMKRGDLVLYYHSNADPSAIVGICEVVREGYPDTTAFDPAHPYYDADSDPATPTWFMVDVRAVSAFARPVTLNEVKETPALSEMSLIKVGRLSVVPVTPAEWDVIVAMGSS